MKAMETTMEVLTRDKESALRYAKSIEETLMNENKSSTKTRSSTVVSNEQGVYIGVLEKALQIKAEDLLGISGHAELLAVLAEMKNDVEIVHAKNVKLESQKKDLEVQMMSIYDAKSKKERVTGITPSPETLLQQHKAHDIATEHESRYELLVNEKQALTDYASELKQNLEKATATLLHHNLLIATLEETSSKNQSSLDKITSEYESLQQQHVSVTESNKVLRKDLNESNTLCRTLEIDLRQRENELESLEAQRESLQIIQDELVDTIRDKSNDYNEVLSDLTRLQGERRQEGGQVALHAQQIELLERVNEDQQSRLEKLQGSRKHEVGAIEALEIENVRDYLKNIKRVSYLWVDRKLSRCKYNNYQPSSKAWTTLETCMLKTTHCAIK